MSDGVKNVSVLAETAGDSLYHEMWAPLTTAENKLTVSIYSDLLPYTPKHLSYALVVFLKKWERKFRSGVLLARGVKAKSSKRSGT